MFTNFYKREFIIPIPFLVLYDYTIIPGVHDVSVKRERSVKRPRINEIFVLLASSSGYTIFNIDKPHLSKIWRIFLHEDRQD